MLPAVLLVATLVVVGLLVVVMLRVGGRIDALRADLERLRVVQRDTSSDVRARLDEGARGWESLETDVRPRLEQLEAGVADLGTRLAENLPALARVREHADAVEERLAASEGRVDHALAAVGQETAERFERVEAAVRTLRNAADERLAELAARVGLLERAGAGETAPADAEPVLETVTLPGEDAEEGTGPHVRGTRSVPRARGGRWILVMLVVATGAAVAFVALH